MEYMMLIYTAEERWNALSAEQQETIMGQHRAILEKSHADGTFRSGNRLVDVGAATTVRNNGGKMAVTDGPFAETKEQLGGYYLFECDDLDKVIGYAGLLQYDEIGSVEIRPILPMPQE